mmetsp:Transcript_42945/g.124174  ORF Transcript_42945/g.124174 Transcript_42945/m.124174 type:complete len:496 (+) Transcript_42945:146-1633(+)
MAAVDSAALPTLLAVVCPSSLQDNLASVSTDDESNMSSPYAWTCDGDCPPHRGQLKLSPDAPPPPPRGALKGLSLSGEESPSSDFEPTLSSPRDRSGKRLFFSGKPKPATAPCAPMAAVTAPGTAGALLMPRVTAGVAEQERHAASPHSSPVAEEADVEVPLHMPIRRVRLCAEVERVGDVSPPSSPFQPQAGSRCAPALISTSSPATSGEVGAAGAGDATTTSVASGKGGATPSTPCLLPGVCTRRVRLSLPTFGDSTPNSPSDCANVPATHEASSHGAGPRKFQLKLATPSSCTSAVHRYPMTPTTPDPARDGFKFIDDELDVVFFDFDGTLTETPGEAATQRWEKKTELQNRASMLRPRLEGLREAGLLLGIISKSTEQTIRESLDSAGLSDLFEGPVVGKALGFEGKAGFIVDMHRSGRIQLGSGGLSRVLLIDDDVRELDRARERGIQTFAAPPEGGLQECDFDEIFVCLNLPSPRDYADDDSDRDGPSK